MAGRLKKTRQRLQPARCNVRASVGSWSVQSRPPPRRAYRHRPRERRRSKPARPPPPARSRCCRTAAQHEVFEDDHDRELERLVAVCEQHQQRRQQAAFNQPNLVIVCRLANDAHQKRATPEPVRARAATRAGIPRTGEREVAEHAHASVLFHHVVGAEHIEKTWQQRALNYGAAMRICPWGPQWRPPSLTRERTTSARAVCQEDRTQPLLPSTYTPAAAPHVSPRHAPRPHPLWPCIRNSANVPVRAKLEMQSAAYARSSWSSWSSHAPSSARRSCANMSFMLASARVAALPSPPTCHRPQVTR